MRPTWDEYFMSIASVVAERSTCDRAKVGAVIVKDNHILATGYNGSPTKQPHCDDIGHMMRDGHCVRTLHAGQNALVQAAKFGVSVATGTIYITHTPCFSCAKMLVTAGILRVVCANPYPDDGAALLFSQAGISLVIL